MENSDADPMPSARCRALIHPGCQSHIQWIASTGCDGQQIQGRLQAIVTIEALKIAARYVILMVSIMLAYTFLSIKSKRNR